jgi:hypothetical protein
MSGYDDLTELHEDFGRVLMLEVRDRTIRELLDRFTGSGGSPSDESLRHLLSSADAAAIQDVVVTAVDAAISGFLYFMDRASPEFDIFSATGKSMSYLSDGLDADPFGPDGWISKYSEFPE